MDDTDTAFQPTDGSSVGGSPCFALQLAALTVAEVDAESMLATSSPSSAASGGGADGTATVHGRYLRLETAEDVFLLMPVSGGGIGQSRLPGEEVQLPAGTLTVEAWAAMLNVAMLSARAAAASSTIGGAASIGVSSRPMSPGGGESALLSLPGRGGGSLDGHPFIATARPAHPAVFDPVVQRAAGLVRNTAPYASFLPASSSSRSPSAAASSSSGRSPPSVHTDPTAMLRRIGVSPIQTDNAPARTEQLRRDLDHLRAVLASKNSTIRQLMDILRRLEGTAMLPPPPPLFTALDPHHATLSSSGAASGGAGLSPSGGAGAERRPRTQAHRPTPTSTEEDPSDGPIPHPLGQPAARPATAGGILLPVSAQLADEGMTTLTQRRATFTDDESDEDDDDDDDDADADNQEEDLADGLDDPNDEEANEDKNKDDEEGGASSMVEQASATRVGVDGRHSSNSPAAHISANSAAHIARGHVPFYAATAAHHFSQHGHDHGAVSAARSNDHQMPGHAGIRGRGGVFGSGYGQTDTFGGRSGALRGTGSTLPVGRGDAGSRFGDLGPDDLPAGDPAMQRLYDEIHGSDDASSASTASDEE